MQTSRPTPPLPPGPLEAHVVELEYQGRQTGIGRDGRYVVVPLNVELPQRCWKSGMTEAEARQHGSTLIRVNRRLIWAPGWTSALALAGFVVFLPLLIVGVVFYYIYRKKVQVQYWIRRDIWWRHFAWGWILALLAIGSVIAGFVFALQTEQLWLLPLAFLLAILLAIPAALYGRIIGVRKVINDWAQLSGAGKIFLDRETFDFAVT